MSCQQLIQEDPYIFTDTISNSANFMHENNSQTKYVPLNRQTIYNRQFRQHEPTISSTSDTNGASKSATTSASERHQQKIVISPSSLREKKNGHFNGKTGSNNSPLLSTPITSPRTSPKFFKSHQLQQQHQQLQQNGKLILGNNSCNSPVINHSIASVSKNQPQKRKQQQQQQQNANSKTIQLNHVAELSSSPLSPITTGIKQEVSNENDEVKYLTSSGVVKREKEIEIKREECDDDDDDDGDDNISDDNENNSKANRVHAKKVKRMNKRKEKFSLRKSLLHSAHARSLNLNVIVEPISVPRIAPQVQADSTLINLIDKRLLQSYRYGDSECKNLTRDERLNMRKLQLRHVLNQYRGAGQMQLKHSTEQFKMQFDKTFNLLKMLDRTKEKIFKKSVKACNTRDCSEEAILSSDYCSKHILSSDEEQFLIRQCCFLYADGHQCRIPVSDVMATVAVCKEHINAPVNQLTIGSNVICGNSNISISTTDSTKPKKPPIQRKQRTKTSPLIRPVKKCGNGKAGRKKKLSQPDLMLPVHRPTMIIHPNDLHKPQPLPPPPPQQQQVASKSNSNTTLPSLSLKQENLQLETGHQFIHQNSGYLLASSQSSYGSMSSGNEDLYLKQDLMTGVCENSYESSEDTGVGGLSENELISHDVIGNFDMESCAELSKVLCSLPSNTLDDLLTEPLHTSRDEEEYLDRAIEEVSATGMDQIAITAFEHLEGLDMLEMLDDDEQRQMISAATNLISMSGFMSSHDQDNNYSAMPSPMMS